MAYKSLEKFGTDELEFWPFCKAWATVELRKAQRLATREARKDVDKLIRETSSWVNLDDRVSKTPLLVQ